MFKNLTLYRFTFAPVIDLELFESSRFAPCGLTQEKSTGWTPPRGNLHDPLMEIVGGQIILKLMVESKKVPAEVLDRLVTEKCKAIEAQTGRKVGRKETKEIKEEAKLELLPMAFAARKSTWVWIDRAAGLVAVGAASQGAADEVLTLLHHSINGIHLTPLKTQAAPAGAMSAWLLDQYAPPGFSIDRECELKATDDSKAVVRYSNHSLDLVEIQEHIGSGKVPTRVAMTWEGRVSFVLTDNLVLKKIAFLEGVLDGSSAADVKDDRFDADVAIATGELSKLIPDLIEALGGEVVLQAAAEEVAA